MKAGLGLRWTIPIGFLVVAGSGQAEVAMMGSLGDSISAATFADSELAAAAREVAPAVQMPKWIPFLGNEENKYTYSWATGSKLHSHADRLRSYLGESARESLIEMNLSVPGDKAAGLIKQIENLETELANAKASLEYVTMWIGANDACQSTDLKAFRKSLDAAFDRLAELGEGEPLRVLVPGLPRIPDLGRKEILDSTTATGLSCRTLRDGMLKFCNPLTVWSKPAEYEARLATTLKYHHAIEDAVERAGQTHANLDVRFVDAIFHETFEPSDLAPDCFHPNARAHQRISDVFWKAQRWFQ